MGKMLEEPLCEVLSVRVTDGEAEAVKLYAEKEKMSNSEALRTLISEGAKVLGSQHPSLLSLTRAR